MILRWLGDATTVATTGSTYVSERPDPESGGMATVEVPDTVTTTGELANGAHYTYRVSNVAAGGPQNGITVFGTKGTIIWLPNDTATLSLHGSDPTPIVPDTGTDLGWRVEQDFVDSIRGGAPVRYTSFADGFRYMRFVDAAWRSLQEGRLVEVGS